MAELNLKKLKHNPILFWSLIGGLLSLSLWLLRGTLAPFLVGFFMAYVLSPVVERLENYGIPRWISSLFFMASFFALILGFFFIFLPFLENQLVTLMTYLPKYGEKLFGRCKPLWDLAQTYTGTEDLSQFKTVLMGSIKSLFDWGLRLILNLFASGVVLANFISFLIFAPLMTFYFLKDWPRMLGKALQLVPPAAHMQLKKFLRDVDLALGNYARGQLIVCSLLAIYYMVGLGIVGLKFAPIIGLITGFLIFIPYIGFLVGLLLSLGVALVVSSTWPLILQIFAVYAIGQVLEGLFLTPRYVGGKTGLHPLWILFALFASGSLFGFMGVIFCLPLAAVFRVVALWLLEAYQRSPYYKESDLS